MIRHLEQRVQHLVKSGTISNTIKTQGTIPTCQVSTFQNQEVHNDRPMYGHWGFTSVPPTGSQCMTLSGYGLNNNKFIFSTHDINTHPQNLKEGEVKVYDSKKQGIYLQEGTSINIDANNIIRITVNGKEVVSVKEGSVYVQGNLLVSNGASGTFSDQSGKVITVQSGIITNIS
ncbi:hypothetical protein ATPR_2871 [Acetobacter tropicalis NBRC 101654]|uniref:Phage baseplate assembly protein V n=1 Tax=Acetobacter tropicalis NBRC 101654 TaxID=749388 RepID=F7VHM2_9PROT|nr:phage baseplate assembly protein [Acetobacter tropicalis]GAA09867.1 hypothetical protein ATPR_2871 [Acetobacter tropicalis NBRC 101654]